MPQQHMSQERAERGKLASEESMWDEMPKSIEMGGGMLVFVPRWAGQALRSQSLQAYATFAQCRFQCASLLYKQGAEGADLVF